MGAVARTRVIKYNDKRTINKKPGLLTVLSWEKSPTRQKATQKEEWEDTSSYVVRCSNSDPTLYPQHASP